MRNRFNTRTGKAGNAIAVSEKHDSEDPGDNGGSFEFIASVKVRADTPAVCPFCTLVDV